MFSLVVVLSHASSSGNPFFPGDAPIIVSPICMNYMIVDISIGYSVIVVLTGLPIGYSVIVALTGLPIGYIVIVTLVSLQNK